MNKSLVLMPAIAKPFLFTLSLATLLLSGCATSQPASPKAAAAPVTTSGAPESIVARYMRAVNNSASANNAEVYWVNVPDEEDLARYAEEK